jgi:SPP1 gp7 family putative phage head morphogenesis protein
MSVLIEIDALIESLAAKLPASMEKSENKRLEKQFRSSLFNYFNTLADAFPYTQIEGLIEQPAKEVSAPPKVPPAGEWDAWLNAFLKAFSGQVTQSIMGHLITIYYAGNTQMMSYGFTKKGKPILFEGPPIRQAVDWARDYGSKLVTKMDMETKSRLAKIISDGIDNKRGVEGLARDIRKEFEDMSKTRARMISLTETNNALSEGSLQRMKDMGVDGKEWIPIRPCQICADNAAAGVIPIDQPFPSGHMRTPAHPNCVCTTAPARLNRRD